MLHAPCSATPTSQEQRYTVQPRAVSLSTIIQRDVKLCCRDLCALARGSRRNGRATTMQTARNAVQLDQRKEGAGATLRKTPIENEKRREGTATADPGARRHASASFRAAKEMFERDGFLDARIADISEGRRVLTRRGTLHYFDSKEQLFREVRSSKRRNDGPTDDPHLARCARRLAKERILKANRRISSVTATSADHGCDRAGLPVESRHRSADNRMKHFAERSERASDGGSDGRHRDPDIDPALVADTVGAMGGFGNSGWCRSTASTTSYVVEQLYASRPAWCSSRTERRTVVAGVHPQRTHRRSAEKTS